MNKIFILFILLFFSCTSDFDKLSAALEDSGENKSELEKVLLHYSRNEADSLKLRAAKFLIENMPGHHYYGGRYVDNYIKRFDSINPSAPPYAKSYLYLFPLYKKNAGYFIETKYDIKNIDSDFLIKNIDFKFELLKVIPFGHEISFGDFCEYLLPYRIDIEPLVDIDQKELDEIINKLKTIKNDFKECNITTFISKDDIAKRIFGSIARTHHMRLTNKELNYINQCDAAAHIKTAMYRLLGIPTTIDFVPDWANSNGRHRWCSLVDVFYKHTREEYIYRSRVAKIYRKTYSHNNSPQYEGNSIPSLFTPFIKDVTNEYIKTADITVPYEQCVKENIKNVYLAIFNDLMWKPVCWSTVNQKGNAYFPSMGKDVVYLPVYYKGSREIIADYPFILEVNKTIHKLVPNHHKKIKLHIERKYPLEVYKLNWAENLIGAVIEASNNRKFSNPDTIGIIKETTPNSIYRIPVPTTKKYRYLRIVQNMHNRRMYLSELSFKNKLDQQIKGNFFLPLPGIKDNESVYDTEEGELGNILSDKKYVDYATINHCLGVDFGEATDLSLLHIGLRCDGNYIYPDNIYELLYFDKTGWVSLETKKGGNYFIEFDNVPSEALYWLRNLTEGKEERIFTFNKGHIKFW